MCVTSVVYKIGGEGALMKNERAISIEIAGENNFAFTLNFE